MSNSNINSNSNSISNSLLVVIRFWKFLNKRRKIQLILLFFLMALNGFLEMITFASLVPFIALISNPEKLTNISVLNNMINLEFDSYLKAVYFVGFVFSLFVISSGTVRTYSLRFILNISRIIGEELSQLAYKDSLYLPYQKFVMRQSADLVTTISTFQDYVVNSITALLNIFSSSIILGAITISLLIINWKIISVSFFIISFSYLVIALFFKNKMKRVSINSANSSREQVRVIQHSFGSIKNIIIDDLYDFYLGLFKKANTSYRTSFMKTIFYTTAPRYVIESLCIVIICIICMRLLSVLNNGYEVITILGVIALAAQKILPSMQQIYGSWTTINSSLEGIVRFQSILKNKYKHKKVYGISRQKLTELNEIQKIELIDISLKYKGDNKDTLEKVNLTINKASRIGIIGETGSGKSTLINILMSLIIPTSGKLLINGFNIYDDKNYDLLYKWRNKISHVPQDIYLIDGSIKENIALGIPEFKVNKKRLFKTIKEAQLLKYIESKIHGVNTIVGERGIQLSGGQKQRIGLARALYKKSEILFLDEATSAVDRKTETKILENIYNLKKYFAIFIISHKPETLANCDLLYKIENGRLLQIK